MNGQLAQIVALTCHGNAAIAGTTGGRFFPDNSTCAFCDSITFVRLKTSIFGRTKETPVAATPDEWLEQLRAKKAIGVRLALTPEDDPNFADRMSAGFVGGGGNWSLEVMLPGGTSETWVASWDVWNQDAPDRRIWRVTYGLVGTHATMQWPLADLTAVTAALRDALERIHAFSARQNCEGFTESFKTSLDCLTDPKACAGYHKDLTVAGTLPEQAASLLHAAQTAWVFGAMGSWNDMGFERQEVQREYETVSNDLFNVLREAIVAAANSSLPARH
jgi:hypothetical protein